MFFPAGKHNAYKQTLIGTLTEHVEPASLFDEFVLQFRNEPGKIDIKFLDRLRFQKIPGPSLPVLRDKIAYMDSIGVLSTTPGDAGNKIELQVGKIVQIFFRQKLSV
jgi:hypothetical protein